MQNVEDWAWERRGEVKVVRSGAGRIRPENQRIIEKAQRPLSLESFEEMKERVVKQYLERRK